MFLSSISAGDALLICGVLTITAIATIFLGGTHQTARPFYPVTQRMRYMNVAFGGLQGIIAAGLIVLSGHSGHIREGITQLEELMGTFAWVFGVLAVVSFLTPFISLFSTYLVYRNPTELGHRLFVSGERRYVLTDSVRVEPREYVREVYTRVDEADKTQYFRARSGHIFERID